MTRGEHGALPLEGLTLIPVFTSDVSQTYLSTFVLARGNTVQVGCDSCPEGNQGTPVEALACDSVALGRPHEERVVDSTHISKNRTGWETGFQAGMVQMPERLCWGTLEVASSVCTRPGCIQIWPDSWPSGVPIPWSLSAVAQCSGFPVSSFPGSLPWSSLPYPLSGM